MLTVGNTVVSRDSFEGTKSAVHSGSTRPNDCLGSIYTAAARKRIVVAVDLDGATLVRAPAIHANVDREHSLADSLITIAHHCPAGPITGRPLEFVKGALSGLIGENAPPYSFAITEAGAHAVNNNGEVVYLHSIDGIDRLKAAFERSIEKYPGAVIEGHTMCSIIVGLTQATGAPAEKILEDMISVARHEINGSNAAGIVSGCHPGINVHMNIVPPGIDKGQAMQFVMDQPAAAGKIPVVFGDSEPDGHMFEVAHAHGGFSVGVGPKAPKASVHVDDYRGAQEIIRRMAELVIR